MNKGELVGKLKKFRDDFVEYSETVHLVWEDYRNDRKSDENLLARERELRVLLTEDLGRLERILNRLGVVMNGAVFGHEFLVFDSALDEQLINNPTKGYGLKTSVQMATKAVGLAEAVDEAALGGLTAKPPSVFVGHSFSEENKKIIGQFIEFLRAQGAAIVLGSEPDNTSVSAKVKGLIDDADIVIGVMTCDNEDINGQWTASRWVIDELVYALGRSKPAIRLIESGCDTKGSIFGDQEYIEFRRENPSEAIVKLAKTLNRVMRR